jgi:hypothetical protein
MTRQPTILQIGLPVDANPLKQTSDNGIDKYFISESESQAISTAQTTAISAAQTTANTALSTANTAVTNAGTALTNAGTAQTTASGAQDTANTANSRLAGDQDYFEGTGTFTGTPSNLVVSSITVVNSQGINYAAGYFNFSYLGKYLITLTQSGDCVNTRTDWYQEVTIRMKEVVGNVFVPLTFKTIPPSGTWNMENTNSNIIDVVGGNQWKPVINMTTLGSTTNGVFRIKIKKII